MQERGDGLVELFFIGCLIERGKLFEHDAHLVEEHGRGLVFGRVRGIVFAAHNLSSLLGGELSRAICACEQR